MHPINKPEVLITFASEKFDNEGRLVDEEAKERIRKLLEALVAWARKLNA